MNEPEPWLWRRKVPDDYRTSIRQTIEKLPLSLPPSPWQQVAVHAVGGLAEIGYDTNSDVLLAVSSQGRGLFDCLSGTRIDRDRSETWEGLDETKLVSPGIGRCANTLFRLAGLHGGGLSMSTFDGWGLAVVQLPWPTHYVFLTPQWASHRFEQWVKIATDGACTFRACGFSETGRTFVIATSCELMIYRRVAA